jgi:hypothetical protein
MRLPAPQNEKPPEGHYQFRLNREPELKKFNYTDKNGASKEGVKVLIYATALGSNGQYSMVDGFLPWEPRYPELLATLGVKHSEEVELAGAVFEADIKYQADKKDPLKSYPRIVNITKQGDMPPDEGGDDIPF